MELSPATGLHSIYLSIYLSKGLFQKAGEYMEEAVI